LIGPDLSDLSDVSDISDISDLSDLSDISTLLDSRISLFLQVSYLFLIVQLKHTQI